MCMFYIVFNLCKKLIFDLVKSPEVTLCSWLPSINNTFFDVCWNLWNVKGRLEAGCGCQYHLYCNRWPIYPFHKLFFLRSSIGLGEVAYVTNSSATWAATFYLWGYKCCACWLFLCFHKIHHTLTWTAGSLTCVHGLMYVCVNTHGGWTHRQRVSTTFLTRIRKNSCAPYGIWTIDLWISSQML